MRLRTTLYRALNPVYAREPMSGRGAAIYGGRFNKKGMPALYTSLSVLTALRESNQAGALQPTTLVSYNAEIDRVFDSRDGPALLEQGIDDAFLADPTWRDQMRTVGEAETQRFASRLVAAGYAGMVVKSFAKGATADDLNVVLWQWGTTAPSRLTLIDDERRLSPRSASD